jgi:hypothetical protein
MARRNNNNDAVIGIQKNFVLWFSVLRGMEGWVAIMWRLVRPELIVIPRTSDDCWD